MGRPYTWQRQHRDLNLRIDTDARALDRVARRYEPLFQKSIDEAYRLWGSKKTKSINPDTFDKPITKKQREVLNKRIDSWIASGNYYKDKSFINRLKNMRNKPVIRRSEYLGLNLRRTVSQIKSEQKPIILKSLYQTWLDSDKTVARLTNKVFTSVGDDFIYKRINAPFQGHRWTTRLIRGASSMYEQLMNALKVAKGGSIRQMKLAAKMLAYGGDYRAKRILLTESTRINTEAKLEAFKNNGVKWYQYMSVMDDRTTDVCVRHDLKVYRVDKMKIGVNAPPLHINCRSTTKAYFIDDRTS